MQMLEIIIAIVIAKIFLDKFDISIVFKGTTPSKTTTTKQEKKQEKKTDSPPPESKMPSLDEIEKRNDEKVDLKIDDLKQKIDRSKIKIETSYGDGGLDNA